MHDEKYNDGIKNERKIKHIEFSGPLEMNETQSCYQIIILEIVE